MQPLYLLLGSNLGDRAYYLEQASLRLAAVLGKTAAISNIYQTAAWGLTDQSAFLNQVLVFETASPPEALLQITQQVEQDLGRIRDQRWGARVIDIDLLMYGSQILDTPTLQLPHPHLHTRRFTLVPLAEVAPTFVHPVLGLTISQLLELCPDPLEVQRWP